MSGPYGTGAGGGDRERERNHQQNPPRSLHRLPSLPQMVPRQQSTSQPQSQSRHHQYEEQYLSSLPQHPPHQQQRQRQQHQHQQQQPQHHFQPHPQLEHQHQQQYQHHSHDQLRAPPMTRETSSGNTPSLLSSSSSSGRSWDTLANVAAWREQQETLHHHQDFHGINHPTGNDNHHNSSLRNRSGASSLLLEDDGEEEEEGAYLGRLGGSGGRGGGREGQGHLLGGPGRDQDMSDDRIMDDAASSEGQGIKRGSESQGDPKDEPRRKRIVTTPLQVTVLSEELRRNPFPSPERRDELAKQLGMEPRRVQVWFQNRRQAERLARGRPPPYGMYPYPWYPSPYGFPPQPGGGGGYPPPMMTGDPSLDILVPYGPRRPSMMPSLPQGDGMMRGGLPPSLAMSGSLAGKQSANHFAASSSRLDGGGAGHSDTLSSLGDYRPPSTLAEDLVAIHERAGDQLTGIERFERSSAPHHGSSSHASHSRMSSMATEGNLQPFHSSSGSAPATSRLDHHENLALHLPPLSSSRPRFGGHSPDSGLPPLDTPDENPFRLPPPKLPSLNPRLGGSSSSGDSSPFNTPFNSKNSFLPPLSAGRPSGGRASSNSTTATIPGRLPSLSQALEMHPELSPDPNSFKYPSGFEHTFSSATASQLEPSLPSLQSHRLRRRSSMGRLDEFASLAASTPNQALSGDFSTSLPPLQPLGSLSSPSSTRQQGGGTSRTALLPPLPSTTGPRSVLTGFPPLSSAMGTGSFSISRPSNLGPGRGSPPDPSQGQPQSRSLRHMPSGGMAQTQLRRESLLESDMLGDPPSPEERRYRGPR